MSDTLHLVYDKAPEELANVPALIKIVDYSIQIIPTLKEIKRMEKMVIDADEEK